MYSRRLCRLCDEARQVIEEVRAGLPAPFRVEEVLIDGDPSLERDYGLRVPVVEVDGIEQFEIAVEPMRLRELLA